MMLSDGSGLVFTVREFLSPLGMYVRSIDGKEPHAVILIIQINQNCHENYFYRILRTPCLLIIFFIFYDHFNSSVSISFFLSFRQIYGTRD